MTAPENENERKTQDTDLPEAEQKEKQEQSVSAQEEPDKSSSEQDLETPDSSIEPADQGSEQPEKTSGPDWQAYFGKLKGWGKCAVRHPWFPIIAIILGSTVLNFILVFEWSLYKSYLTSDMHGYWERAVQIFTGDEKTPNTWVSNAPFYSRVIADIFTWLEYFKLRHYGLEVMLSLNILLSMFATLSLYLIGLRALRSNTWALCLAATYAFAYPNLYFNTFLLGEPFAIPIIISALYLVMRWQNSYKIFYAGIILAFGVGVRPSNGLLGLPCALFIMFHGASLFATPIRQWIKVYFPRAVKAGLFTIGFALVIFSILAENNRISDGKLRGITAHSGYNFFLGQTQVHLIQSSWDGLSYGFVPSSVAGNPEYGSIKTNIPIYDSERYYEEGWKILKANPHLWWDHVKKYNHLFFNNLFPAVPSVKGFDWFFDPFRHITFYMLVFMGLLFITFRERDTDKSYVFVFGSIFCLCAAALFFYTVTHQYFTNFSYTLYVLAFIYLRSAVIHFTKYKIFILSYIAIVALSTISYYSYKANRHLFIEPKIHVKLEQNRSHVHNLDQTKRITRTETIDVNNLEFLQADPLKHRSTGTYEDWKYNFFLTATTEFEVKEEGLFMFTFYADDGYRVSIDGKVVMQENRMKKMNEFNIRSHYYLTEGLHSMKVELFQAGVFTGLVGYYRRIDNSVKPGPFEYSTRFGQGNFIGDDSESVRFYFPGEAPKALQDSLKQAAPVTSATPPVPAN